MMTTRERDYLIRLQKRHDWLRARVARSADRDLSFDRAEMAALAWAIEFIEAALTEG